MAKIVGLRGLQESDVYNELRKGARFVVFEYTISIGIMTFRRVSAVHFLREADSGLWPALQYSLVTMVLGWWGFPWGPIYSLSSLATNVGGGRDVTGEIRGPYTR